MERRGPLPEELLHFGREQRNRSYTRWYRAPYSVGLYLGTSRPSGLSVYSPARSRGACYACLAHTGLPVVLPATAFSFALRTSAAGFR